MASRNEFLSAYREALRDMYTWGEHQDVLDEFMVKVVSTINGESEQWTFSGTAAANAWKAIGMKGAVTLEAVRALPN